MKKDKIRDRVELTTLISIFLCSVFGLTPNLNAYELPDTPFDFEQIKADAELIKQSDKPLFDLKIKEPVSTVQWITFGTLQLADIYTTYRGLKYDCVYEMNPIAGEKPSVPQMFLVKTLILLPAIESDIQRQTLEPKTIDNINFLMALVVGNNYNVWHGAEQRCTKR